MAVQTYNTSSAYVKARVNASSSIQGNWPNIMYRTNFYFQYYTTAWAYMRNIPITYTMHNKVTSQTVYFDVGKAVDPVWTSNMQTLDLPWGNARSLRHIPGVSISGGYTFSSTITLDQLTIPAGTLSASLSTVSQNSVTMNVSYTSPHNFWFVRIYNTSGKLYVDGAINGKNEIKGLDPGKDYVFNIELWGRDGTQVLRRQVSARTLGNSYTENKTITIGNSLPITVKTYSDTFTNNIKLMINGNQYYSKSDFKSTNLQYPLTITFTESQITSIYNIIPNALSVKGSVIIDTYHNGILIGSSTSTVTFNVDASASTPLIDSVTYSDVTTAKNITGNATWIVQDVSKIQVKCNAASRNGSTIKRYIVKIDDYENENSTSTINSSKIITANTGIYTTVIDSRGLQTTVYIPFVKFIPYEKPVLLEAQALRVNDVEKDMKIVLKGKFNRLSINGIDKNTTLTFKYRYKKTSITTWGSYVTKQLTVNNNEFSYNNIVEVLSIDDAYDIEITIQDYFNTIIEQVVLLKGMFELFIGDGKVEINGKLYYNDKLLIDIMYPIGSIMEFDRTVNPNESIGGIWEKFGNGRVTVGVDTSQTEFNSVKKTGGSNTHLLSTEEMPSHSHAVYMRTSGSEATGYGLTKSGSFSDRILVTGGQQAITVYSSGGSKVHNNLQPYITVYRWVRTA